MKHLLGMAAFQRASERALSAFSGCHFTSSTYMYLHEHKVSRGNLFIFQAFARPPRISQAIKTREIHFFNRISIFRRRPRFNELQISQVEARSFD